MIVSLSSHLRRIFLMVLRPFSSRLLTVTAVILFVQVKTQQQTLSSNRQCKRVFDQVVDEDNLKMAYKASILSAISYLEYEKDPGGHPWQVEFESTGPSTTLSAIKFTLLRNLCLTKNVMQRFATSLQKSISSNWFTRKLLKKNSAEDAGTAARQREVSCPAIDGVVESIEFRWFFADWREGIWHDTEVLLGESATTAVIVFRGSDSAADLFTNSQTMEPALHSYYFGAQEGSLHRGMLNAYGRVDKGRLIALDTGVNKNSAFGTNIRDTYESFREIQKSSVNATCTPDRPKSRKNVDDFLNDVSRNGEVNQCKKNSKSDSGATYGSVVVSDTLLSSLLINAVLSALSAGKKVILTGHSLGGSLALLLALDIAVNHTDSDDGVSSCTKNKKCEKKPNSKTTEKGEKSNPAAENIFEKEENVIESKNVSKDTIRKKELHCGSYLHHKGRRCTQTANPSILNNLYVVTFGQPDLASPAFFDSVKNTSQAVTSLLQNRYTRVVSLSHAPTCEPDIITQLVGRVGDLLGDWLLGTKEGGDKISKTSSQSLPDLTYMSRQKKTERKVVPIAKQIDSKTKSNEKKITNKDRKLGDKNKNSEKVQKKKKKSYFGTRGKSSQEESKTKNRNKNKNKNKNENKHGSSIDSEGGRGEEEEELHSIEGRDSNLADGQDEDYDGAGTLIFVCSGTSKDSIEAHRMNHYVHGLQIMSRTYNRKTKTSDTTRHKEKRFSRIMKNKTKIKNFLYRKMAGKKKSEESDDVITLEKKSDSDHINDRLNKPGSCKILTVRAGSTSVTTKGKVDSKISVNTFPDHLHGTPESKKQTKESEQKGAANKGKKKVKLQNNGLNNSNNNNENEKRKEKEKDSNLGRSQKTDSTGKKKRKPDQIGVGLHLATNLRLDSALNLNLLSTEKYDYFNSEDYGTFYAFI